MKQEEKILKQIRSTVTLRLVGKFSNEFGEEFVVYQGKQKDTYYVTGDEFDWQDGWQLKRSLLPDSLMPLFFACRLYGMDKTFTFSMNEQKELFKLLKTTK